MSLPSDPVQPAVTTAAAPAPAAVPGRGLTIAAFVLAFLVPIVGAILGIVALVKARKNGGPQGLAIAAIILGVLFTIGWIIATVMMLGLVGAAATLVAVCTEYGAGVWEIDGVTFTCE